MTFSITRERRRWEAFPGKNSFCCDGRCICARSLLAFYSTLVMIIVPSLLFFGFESRFLTILLSPAIPVVAALLLIFVLVNLFFACCTDPGILPRATYDESHWLMTQIGSSSGEFESSPPRVKEVMINNRVIKLKYCYTCKIFRPPRTSHCSSCDCCVERFDHHCPWVGNCVGRRNYRYFFMFVSSLTLYCGFLLACTITNFVMLGLKNDFVFALKNCPLSIVILLSSFFGMWAVGGIASYHLSLIAREVSTNEAIKGSYNDKQCGRSSNPFNRGNFVGNMIWILCGPLYPSFIYLREPLEGDELPQLSRQLIPLEDGKGYCHPILSSSARKPAVSHATTPLPPYVPPLPAITPGPSQAPATTERAAERRESSVSSSGYSGDLRSALVTPSVNV